MPHWISIALMLVVIVIVIAAERGNARETNEIREEVERLNQRIDRIPGTPIRLPVHVRIPAARSAGDAVTEVMPVVGRHRRGLTGDAPVVVVND